MKILVAIDASTSSATVVDEVKSRVWSADAQIQLLNVVDTTGIISIKGDLHEFMRAQTEAAQSLLRSAADRLAQSASEISSVVIEGYPPSAIVERAREWGADFLFVGSHSHSALARFFLGSVAGYVVRQAHCSVVITRPSEKTVCTKILFATDGSEAALAAARSVAERKWADDAEFLVLGIVDEIIPAIDPWYGGGVALEQIQEETEKLAREGVKSAQKVFLDAGLKATTAVTKGHPKAAIVEEAESWRANLVIVASHGRRGVTRLLMGSVSESVARHAHCSVEVIRDRQLY